MAVDAVGGVTTTPPETSNPPAESGSNKVVVSEATLAKMTAKEIIDGYTNQGWSVPDNILTWAQEEVSTNPDSKATWGDVSGSAPEVGGGEQDVVSYQDMMEEDGLSLKQQCIVLSHISAAMERHDLRNITRITPYLQMIPTDETEGANGESEVSNVFSEIFGNMKGKSIFSDDFQEGIKFFSAVQKGAKDELGDISADLETMQSDLNKAIDDAKQSNATGTETIDAGKELRSSSKWWHFGKKFIASLAIDQGEETVNMSDNTSKFATAIANDVGITIGAIQENIETVETTGEEGGIEEEPTVEPTEGEPSTSPTDDGGATPPVSGGGTTPSTGSDTTAPTV